MVWCLVGFSKGDSPIQEQPQTGAHGVSARLHNHKFTLGDSLQLIRRHKRTAHHLNGCAAVLPLVDGAALHGLVAQGFGQHFGSLALWSEAAKNRILMR